MDVWTLDELRQVAPEAWIDGEVDFLYKVFGGRVRNVLGGDLKANSLDAVIESTALWFFGNTVQEAHPASWNRALQLIRNTIADARGKTTKGELAIQTSLFWVVNSSSGSSGFSSTFLKLVAGWMKENMEASLWNKGLDARGFRAFEAYAVSLTKTELIPSVADIETIDDGNFMLVDATITPNIMLQFTASLKHGKATDTHKWANLRANLGARFGNG